jgi:hypothetical protein
MSRRSGLITAFLASLLVAVPVLASHVAPEFTRDAESCGILTPGTVELLVDASELEGNVPSSGEFQVNVQLSGALEGGSISFSGATLPVESAFVAGLDGGNLYDYPEPVRSDEGLVAPDGQPITSVSFCYIVAADRTQGETGGVKGATGAPGTTPPTDSVEGTRSPDPQLPIVLAVVLLLTALAIIAATRLARRSG